MASSPENQGRKTQGTARMVFKAYEWKTKIGSKKGLAKKGLKVER